MLVFYLIVPAKARHSGLVMPSRTRLFSLANRSVFALLATRVFATAVIDNEGETLLNGNT
jgi:hypothetical protein